MIIARISVSIDLYRGLNLIMSFEPQELLISLEIFYVFLFIYKDGHFIVMRAFVVLARVEVGG